MTQRRNMFKAAAAAYLALTVALPAQHDFRIPTVGETLGAQAANALNSIREGRRKVAEMNAAILQSRQRFWSLYPNGEGLKEAEAAYAAALWEKDLYYAWLTMSKQIRAGFESDVAKQWEVGEQMESQMRTLVGEVDGGIHAMARPTFFAWVGAVHAYGIENSRDKYAAYARDRNQAEYYNSPRSPLRSSDPKEYLLAVLVRSSYETKPRRILSSAQAQEKYITLAGILGEANLLGAAKAAMRSRRRQDPYYLNEDTPVRPEPVIDRATQLPGEKGAMKYLHFTRPEQWIESWQETQKAYEKFLKERGAAHITRALAMIESAPKTFHGGEVMRYVLLDPQKLGCSGGSVDGCFKHLLSLSPEELAKQEKEFRESLQALTPVAGHFDIIWTDPEADPGVSSLSKIVGAVDGALYILVRQGGIAKVNADGGGAKLIHAFKKDDGTYADTRLTSAVLGKDGYIYGSIISTPSKRHSRICRIDPDGKGFEVIGDLTALPEVRGQGFSNIRFVSVDNDGNLIGQLLLQAGIHLFIMKGDGSEARTLYKFPFAPTVLTVGDGGDGFLYGLAVRSYMASVMHKSGDDLTMGGLFRVRQSGADFQTLDEFQTRGLVERRLLVGGDSTLYMASSVRTGVDDGFLYRVDRDGTGGAVVHLYRQAPNFTGAFHRMLVENTDGLLYGIDRHPEGKGDSLRLFRIGKNSAGLKYFEGEVQGTMDLIAHNGAIYGINVRSQVYRLTPPPPDTSPRLPESELAAARVPQMHSAGRVLPPPKTPPSASARVKAPAVDTSVNERGRTPPTQPTVARIEGERREAEPVRQTRPDLRPTQVPQAGARRGVASVGRSDPRAPLKAEQAITYDGTRIEFTGNADEIAELEAAANAGNTRACLLLGELIVHGKIDGTMADAAKWFENGYRRRDAECTARLARLLIDGHAAEANPRFQHPQMWRQLASTAAAGRSALGMYLMAECSARGIGMRPSEPIARQWYQKAAAAGHPLAQKWCEENAVSYTSTGARPAGRVR